MRISLITVSYNACEDLEQTIKSVTEQSWDNLEYIVVDGASNDGTLEMLKKYRSRVGKLISEPDKGIYDALNKGLGMAEGDIVGLLHAGDRFANPDILNKVAELFETENADVVYGDLQYVTSFEPLKIFRNWESGTFYPSMVRKGWMPPHPTVYFRRELLERVGLFDTSFKIAADYDWLLRVMTLDGVRMVYLPEVMIHMATGGASNKSLGNIIRKSREDYKALRKNHVGGLLTLIGKNLGKLGQFFAR